MKKRPFLAGFLLFIATLALAGSPVIWYGDKALVLPTGGLAFNGADRKAFIDLGTVDPLILGYAAPIGSFGISNVGGVGQIYLKSGALDTDWNVFLTSSGVLTPSEVVVTDGVGNITTETTLAPVRGGFGINYSAEVTPGIPHWDGSVFTNDTIVNADIDASADIDRSKIDAGTANHVVINDGVGDLSSESALSASRGGLGTDASAFNGVVKAVTGSFSSSAIVNADIDNAAAISRSKIAVGTANHVVLNDGTGALSSSANLTYSAGELAIKTGINFQALTLGGNVFLGSPDTASAFSYILPSAYPTAGQHLGDDGTASHNLTWLSHPTANSTTTGYLSSTDWLDFDQKLDTPASATANYLFGVDNVGTATEWKAATMTAAGTLTIPTSQTITLTDTTGGVYSGTNLITSLTEISNSVTDFVDSGFLSWGAGTTYYTITGEKLQIDRTGTGYIKSKKVTWASGQQTSVFAANTLNYVYIDSSGLIGSTTTRSKSIFENNIVLFEVLYDGTNYTVVRENHPYAFATQIALYLHDTVGTIIYGSGAIATRVTTGTGDIGVGDRQIKIVGNDILDDHGIETVIPDSAGAAVTWNVYYTGPTGKWERYVQQTEIPMYYNNAGTPTALGTGPLNDNTVYVLYVSKDNLNTSTPNYYAVMNSSVYSTITQANTAISTNAISRATNELDGLELAQLGYAIVENNGTSGYINTLIISKSTLNQQFVGGGVANVAGLVSTNTTNFNSILSGSDTNVQSALDTLDDGALNKATGTAKGDLIVYTASATPTPLPTPATNGWVLTSDSAQTEGIKWSAIPSQTAGNSGNVQYNSAGVFAGSDTIGVTVGATSTLNVKDTITLSGSSSGTVGLKAAAAAGSTTFTLPTADGSVNQVLRTDGNATLSWTTPASGIKNFITYGDAEINATTGWALYNDGASASPVDGTGGTVGAGVTLAVTSTTPNEGTYSYLWHKDGSDQQGRGMSYDFTVPKESSEQKMRIEISYQLWGTEAISSPFTVWVYDKTGSTLLSALSPNNTETLLVQGDLYWFNSTFDIPAGSTDLRLILHIGNTTATDWDIAIDSVRISYDYTGSKNYVETTIPKSVGTAKGQILAFSASATPSPVPTPTLNNLVLTSDSSAGTGVKWAAAPGGGLKNFITYGDAELAATTGWATFADAAGTSPVDGTGGSANITWTVSATSPLEKTNSYVLTKGAADRQGEGVSYDFTVDAEQQGKVQAVKFSYYVSSGTYADNDMTVWLYDVTNAALVTQIVPYQIKNSGLIESWAGTTQLPINSTSYRLIFHVSSTSGSAYTLKFDSVSVGPQSVMYGPVTTDWVAFTPTWTSNGTAPSIGNGSLLGWYRKVGDSSEIYIKLTTGTTTTYGTNSWFFSLPSGQVIDTTKNTVSVSGSDTFGVWSVASNTGNRYLGSVGQGTTTSNIYSMYTAGGNTPVGQTVPYSWTAATANQEYTAHFTVPIVGWSSSQVLSSEAATAEENIAYSATSTTVNNTTPTVVPTTRTFSKGGISQASGTYTIKKSGRYRLTANLRMPSLSWAAGQVLEIYYSKNGGGNTYINRNVAWASVTTYVPVGGSVDLNLVAGDTIAIKAYSDVSGTPDNFFTSLVMIQGPSQIAASESVNARYTTAAGQSINTGSATIVDFGTKSFDSHISVTTGASWKFTPYISGKYCVRSTASFTFTPSAQANVFLSIYKNGAEYSRGPTTAVEQTAGINVYGASVSDCVDMLSGNYIDIRVFQNSGGAKTLDASALNNYVSIIRTGN